ncbi:hypothetical protein [Sediminitomix flava]|uniref:Uncharacterized protein n=1 Tax=Sediminitomix flava TaxID=379075 RepID=A0A315ZA72_SEDFL|nr:hypothetical protein [Sediminitomix flava]PWJ42172.1 hypothetical protein BC781_103422 [Sediminitomix flava]
MKPNFLRSVFRSVLFIFLIILTQIGGIVLLLHYFLLRLLKRKQFRFNFFSSTIIYLSLYLLFSLFLVPSIAPFFGRTPLPYNSESIKPLNKITILLNRHYVNHKLKNSLEEIATDFQNSYPHSSLIYLDANFPFWDGFPLIPHLSHNDGQKIDLAFYYKSENGEVLEDTAPSWIGYGAFEEAKKGEENTNKRCLENGFIQYDLAKYLSPSWSQAEMILDIERTMALMNAIIRNSDIQKIFIEPHLKSRMKLTHSKVRFHGCHAVRHDDHIHIQL